MGVRSDMPHLLLLTTWRRHGPPHVGPTTYFGSVFLPQPLPLPFGYALDSHVCL